MESAQLKEAVDLAKEVDYVVLATADEAGNPHIAVAGQMAQAGRDCVTVSEWFCPGTVRNLRTNPAVSVVVWDKDSDRGYQLLGSLKAVQDIGVLDGYMAGEKRSEPLPQVEKQLLIQVEKVLEFKHGPHSDTDIKEHSPHLFT